MCRIFFYHALCLVLLFQSTLLNAEVCQTTTLRIMQKATKLQVLSHTQRAFDFLNAISLETQSEAFTPFIKEYIKAFEAFDKVVDFKLKAEDLIEFNKDFLKTHPDYLKNFSQSVYKHLNETLRTQFYKIITASTLKENDLEKLFANKEQIIITFTNAIRHMLLDSHPEAFESSLTKRQLIFFHRLYSFTFFFSYSLLLFSLVPSGTHELFSMKQAGYVTLASALFTPLANYFFKLSALLTLKKYPDLHDIAIIGLKISATKLFILAALLVSVYSIYQKYSSSTKAQEF